MSRTRKAAIGSVLTYAQFSIALVSGFILFPVIISQVGAYDNGLWLMSGELVGYLLLGDLGVFAVLPWLIAARHGAGDYHAIGRYLADATMVGAAVGAVFLVAAGGVWWANLGPPSINPVDWAKVRGPLALLLVLSGLGFPLRAFIAVLNGLQDVVFGGLSALAVSVMSCGMSLGLVLSGWGLHGLALAAGVPPLLVGVAGGVRLFGWHREALGGSFRPGWVGCWRLLREGFGAWLGGLGVRLLTASNALVFATLGRPDWATVYAATGKAAQVTQPMCGIVPDSGLVGLSQMHGESQQDRTRQTVMCMLMLYLLIPGVTAVGLLAANRWFVGAWIGTDFYAGDSTNALIAANLIVGVAAGGLFKVVGVAGYRIAVGAAVVVAGVAAIGLGYVLGTVQGLVGVAEAGLIANVVIVVPFGLFMVRTVYQISPAEILTGYAGWAARTGPVMLLASWVGWRFAGGPVAVVIVAALALIAVYILSIRPMLGRAPWPDGVRRWLTRLRLIPRLASGSAL